MKFILLSCSVNRHCQHLMKFARFRVFFSGVTTNNIFCAYLIFSLIGVFSHVLWRDEMQGWLVAVGSESIRELWSNNAPSGHPIVYPMLTYISSIVYENPLSMQLHWEWILINYWWNIRKHWINYRVTWWCIVGPKFPNTFTPNRNQPSLHLITP